jgi:hypothetical protein
MTTQIEQQQLQICMGSLSEWPQRERRAEMHTHQWMLLAAKVLHNAEVMPYAPKNCVQQGKGRCVDLIKGPGPQADMAIALNQRCLVWTQLLGGQDVRAKLHSHDAQMQLLTVILH